MFAEASLIALVRVKNEQFYPVYCHNHSSQSTKIGSHTARSTVHIRGLSALQDF